MKNVNETILFFNKYNMHDTIEGSTYHFMITDKNGDSAVIEYVDNEIKIIRPYMNNTLNYLYVTNFYLSKNTSDGMMGFERYNILEKNLKIENVTMEWNDAMNLLKEVQMDITIWSNIYNTFELSVVTAYRKDYSNLYKFNVLEPMKEILKNQFEPIFDEPEEKQENITNNNHPFTENTPKESNNILNNFIRYFIYIIIFLVIIIISFYIRIKIKETRNKSANELKDNNFDYTNYSNNNKKIELVQL